MFRLGTLSQMPFLDTISSLMGPSSIAVLLGFRLNWLLLYTRHMNNDTGFFHQAASQQLASVVSTETYQQAHRLPSWFVPASFR